ncbi:hypothetical protein ACF0H5_002408 [Mactra antiquata]
MSSKRTADTITLSHAQFESIISKLSVLETCCSKLGKLDKLDNIEKLEKLDKLDNIESTLSTITSKITNIETRVTENEHNISDIERSVEFVAKQYDTVVKVQSSSNSNSELRLDIEEIKSINHQLKEELLDLKCRNMRDNLIFTNIPEETNENTEATITNFFETKLNLSNIKIERAHRLSNFKIEKDSPLLSDKHCAISLSIDVGKIETKDSQIQQNTCIKKWCDKHQQSFHSNVDIELVESLCLNLDNTESTDKDKLNHINNEITSVIINAAEKTCGTYTKTANDSKNIDKRKTGKTWFDGECNYLRKAYHRCRKKYHMVISLENKTNLIDSNKQYKRAIKQKMYKYKRECRKKSII